jgi:hypothetical protein
MTRGIRVSAWLLAVVMSVGVIEAGEAAAEATDKKSGDWAFGASLGVLRNTPDDTAFALNLNADRFVAKNLSVGPFLQLAFTGDMSQIGLSGQAKYWFEMTNRWKLTVQGGIGFVHSAFREDDTSWLIPLGVGLDYGLTDTMSVTATFLLNLTDLDTGRGSGANVMPGLIFGVRF